VPPERDHLGQTLEEEDSDKDIVETVEGLREELILRVVLYWHRHHTEQDHEGDRRIEATVFD